MPGFDAIIVTDPEQLPSAIVSLDFRGSAGKISPSGGPVVSVENTAVDSLDARTRNDDFVAPWWDGIASGDPITVDSTAFSNAGGITVDATNDLTLTTRAAFPVAPTSAFTAVFVGDFTPSATGEIFSDDADGLRVTLGNAGHNLEYQSHGGTVDTGVASIAGAQIHIVRFGYDGSIRTSWRRNGLEVYSGAYDGVTVFGGGTTRVFGGTGFVGKAGRFLFFNRFISDYEAEFLESIFGKQFQISNAAPDYTLPKLTPWVDPPDGDRPTRIASATGHPQFFVNVAKTAAATHVLALALAVDIIFTPLVSFPEYPYGGTEPEPFAASLASTDKPPGTTARVVLASRLAPRKVGHHLFGYYAGSYGALYLPFDVTGFD